MKKWQYLKYLDSVEWREFKEKYYKVFDKKCVVCGSRKLVSLHHKDYSRLYCEKFDDVEALCYLCHAKQHNKLKIPSKKRKAQDNNRPMEYLIDTNQKTLFYGWNWVISLTF